MLGYFFFGVSIKFNASFLDIYFTPNSSATKLNIVSRFSCLKRPGAVELEVFDERDIVNLSCLWESIHAFPNLDKDSVVNK